MPLMKTEPASIAAASRFPRSRSRVHRLAPRPKGVPLASSIACSSVSTGSTAATGPKVSSAATGRPGETPSSTVGA